MVSGLVIERFSCPFLIQDNDRDRERKKQGEQQDGIVEYGSDTPCHANGARVTGSIHQKNSGGVMRVSMIYETGFTSKVGLEVAKKSIG